MANPVSVVLKRGRDHSVRRHHPWIFSGAIESAPADLSVGATVAVVASGGEILGYGSYSPASQIRVRMLSFDRTQVPDDEFIADRVRSAVRRRVAIDSSCGTEALCRRTNAMRLVNAESDGLPGVIADVYAGYVVCQFSSAGAEFWKATIVAALMECVPGVLGVGERTDLKDREKEGLPAGADGHFQVLAGAEPPVRIEIFEGPCKFGVDVRDGHKTGYYLDQRDARAAIGALARGRDVLNCFCYTGGFGLYARAAGAKSVTQVDISEDALALARENEALTPGGATKMEYVAADVFAYLRTCRDAGLKFDLIVLDPPKFAAVKSQVMKAARGYKDINLLAMKLLKPNGILATFSCSGAMTAELFDQVLAEAALDAHREFQIIGRTHPGADHPVGVNFPEGEYLKGVILRETSPFAKI